MAVNSNKESLFPCSFSKEVVLKKTFVGMVIVALVLCLILYSHSNYISGPSSKNLFHRVKWRHFIKQKIGHKDDLENELSMIPMHRNTSTELLQNPNKDEIKLQDVDSNFLQDGSMDLKVNQNTGKYLIYLCDDTAWCGGWGDRQRGVVSLYLLALVHNRSYGIKMTSPCDLAQFYQPNEIAWLVDDSINKNRTSKVIYSIDSIAPMLEKNNKYTEDVIYVQTNMDRVKNIKKQFRSKMPKYLVNKNRTTIFRDVWTKLMKPTPRLQKRLGDIIYNRNKTGSLVCAHVRIGYSKNMRNDPPRLERSSADIVWEFMETFKNVGQYFVATDNEDVRKSARDRFGERYTDTGGTILHIDRQRNKDEACEGFETAILDQLILTKCDILIISESNFSIRGSMLKTVLKDVYIFNGSTIKPYKPFTHFRH